MSLRGSLTVVVPSGPVVVVVVVVVVTVVVTVWPVLGSVCVSWQIVGLVYDGSPGDEPELLVTPEAADSPSVFRELLGSLLP